MILSLHMNSLVRAIGYLDEIQPNLSQTFKGAERQVIQRLSTFFARPLPSEYEEFLLLMGEDHNGLTLFANHGTYDCSIKAALELQTSTAKKQKKTDKSLLIEEVLLIGTFRGTCQDCGPCALEETKEGFRVIQYEGKKSKDRVLLAASLSDFIFLSGYRQYWLQRYKSHFAFSLEESLPSQFDELVGELLRLEFSAHPHVLKGGTRLFSSKRATVVLPSSTDHVLLGDRIAVFGFNEAVVSSIVRQIKVIVAG